MGRSALVPWGMDGARAEDRGQGEGQGRGRTGVPLERGGLLGDTGGEVRLVLVLEVVLARGGHLQREGSEEHRRSSTSIEDKELHEKKI